MQGYYHSIEHFGTVDGHGIRYVLFLSGCQLRCRFCHNPDTWLKTTMGISVEEVMTDVLHYRHFYDASEGGLTVSGGEPLLQAEFIAQLFTACRKERIHTTIDTSGYCPKENFSMVLSCTDAALFSIKAVDHDKHQALTGFDNDLIIDNLRYISGQIPVTLRYVVIPGLTNLPEDIENLAKLIHSLSQPVPVELLPYHTYGRKKWDSLNLPYTLDATPPASTDDVASVAKQLQSLDVTVLHQPT